jgi:hypothetical protein
MRAAPAVAIDLYPSAAWRGVLALLAAAALAVSAVWALERADAVGGVTAALVAGLGAAVLVWAWQPPPRRLRWDGQGWWLVPAQGAEQPGSVLVALDLGGWLLLQFRPAPAPPVLRRGTWLALQRRGLDADWHALRCALYSPRPAAPSPAGTDPSA